MSRRKSLEKTIEDLENSEELSAFEELMEDFKPKVDELKSKVEDGVHQAKSEVEREVKKNPWAALGVVALVFFVLGLLFGRRSRD